MKNRELALRARPRVVIGGLHHETHTFLGGRTRVEDLTWLRGERLIEAMGASSPMGGALAVARECDWELLPLLDGRGYAGPTVEDAVVEKWWSEWEQGLRALQKDGGFEAIFLTLHGAMVSESFLDVEGELLRRLRDLVGPQVFIAGTTDLHGNFSALMAQNSDALVTYRENPHCDGFDTGQRAARLLEEMLLCGHRPRQLFARAPIVWPPTGTSTAFGPLRELERRARELEASRAEFGTVNVYGGFAFSDTPDTGVSFSITTWGDDAPAERALSELVELAWHERARGAASEPDAPAVLGEVAALLRAPDSKRGPIVLAEPSDNIGGAAPGDGTHLLRACLEFDFGLGRPVLVGATLCDPDAVARASELAAGLGETLELGGWSGPLAGEPLRAWVEPLACVGGAFELDDPHSHLAAAGACVVEMGPSVLVRARVEGAPNRALVLLTSLPTPPFDLGQWRCVGADPRTFDVVLCKAAVGHRQTYDTIARANFSVSTPGPCASDLSHLPYIHLPRPIFPLDVGVQLTPAALPLVA